MSIIKHIDGIPAFSTRNEAISWGRRELNINGYHIHYHNGNKIYMAGINHDKIKEAQYQKYLNSLGREIIIDTTMPPPSTPTNLPEENMGGGGY